MMEEEDLDEVLPQWGGMRNPILMVATSCVNGLFYHLEELQNNTERSWLDLMQDVSAIKSCLSFVYR